MGRSPCCDDNTGIKKGPWTPEEDKKLVDYVNKNGHGSWRALPKLAGLNRCGKSCRLRWANYLRPDIKRGKFSDHEEQIIIKLHSVLGNKWSTIAQRIPGRTDNEIKNYWNTNLRKKLLQRGIDPVTHRPRTDHLNLLSSLPQLLAASNFNTSLNNALTLQNADINQIAKAQLFQNLLHVLSTTPPSTLETLKLMGSMPLNQPLFNNPFAQTNIANFPANFFLNPTSYVSNATSFDTYQRSQLAQTTAESDALSGDYTLDNGDQFRAMWPTETTASSDVFSGEYKLDKCDQLKAIWSTDDSLPALVSDSPECSTINKMENINTNTNIYKPSSSSTTFDAWGEPVGDEAVDNYWKEILDQVAYPSWPMS